ncbi:hypothetical protein MC45_00075 [Sphingomonas taxi]|uniref:NACHT domain-containing protein n=1 Tax=Sphingomonas taxi TaxID=1549858 RepID=A0A097EC18_9SPHN|nr:hypothetical protein [Sphingomonas taxi]AIT05115.1 hypothetical protein MC45_00075 [Sphingomonas taxi]
MSIEALVQICKWIAAVGGAAFLLVRMGYWLSDRRHITAAVKLKSQRNQSVFTPSYTDAEIAAAFRTYVQPDCGQADPSHETDNRHVADIREPVFSSLDRFVDHALRRRHFLVLADSGMGKTTLCLNYFRHAGKRKTGPVALVSLSRPGADAKIGAIANKRDTLLIVDALDEDPAAQNGVEARLSELLSLAADYVAVIITCRSQFFRDASAIPKDTGVSVIGPRMAGAGSTYTLWHLYLMPFTTAQISTYISKQFPLWNPKSLPRRHAAERLVARVPELSGRPMLLELVPDLIREGAVAQEVFDLYEYMVQKWVAREERWIDGALLIAVSKRIAVEIHARASSGRGDRLSRNEVDEIAKSISGHQADWDHLSTRSLLNRDNDGLLKFAHRSIMEYFFVLAAIDADDRCFGLAWTDVMRDLFVSWGYTASGVASLKRAKEILTSDLSATKLVPLSDPPTEPNVIVEGEILLAAARRSKTDGVRRLVHSSWRADSVRIEEAEMGIGIVDLACDLEWLVPSLSHDIVLLPLAQQLRIAPGPGQFRSPSFDELVSLCEALTSSGRIDLLVPNRLYLLGDILGPDRHLVVEAYEEGPKFGMLRAIGDGRRVAGTDYKLAVYEVSRFLDPTQLQQLRVASLFVRRTPKRVTGAAWPTLL